jgi:hypothetical protein
MTSIGANYSERWRCMSEPIGNGPGRSNHDASLLATEVLLGWTSTSEVFIKALSS